MALDPKLLALVKKSKSKHTRSGNSVQLKEGKTTLRILAKGNDQFWLDIGVHWIKLAENAKPVAVVGCREEVFGEPCPICAAIDQASAAATSDEETAIIKQWKAKKGVLVNALIRSGSDASEEPQVVELRPTAWAAISGTIAEYAEQDINVLDPGKDGIDFVVERRGKGFDTEYSVMVAPRSKPVPDGVLDRLHDLKEFAESQYFRGDETKALTAIANLTGISVGTGNQIAAPRRSPMLAKPAAIVEDAEVLAAAEAEIADEVEVIEETPPTQPEPTPEPAAEDDEEAALLAQMAALKAKKAAKAKAEAEAKAKDVVAKAKADLAAKAAAAKKAAPAAAKPADEFNSSLGNDEIDELLADLDS